MRLAVTHIGPLGIRVFEEVAEYVYAAIRALGHDVVLCPANRFAYGGRTNILLGNNILDHPDLEGLCVPPASIFYNFEQATDRWMDAVAASVVRHRPLALWDWSVHSAAVLGRRGIRAVVVPYGYVPEMVRVPRVTPQTIDVLFLGSVSERRRTVLRGCIERGLQLHRGKDTWGSWRDVVIGASKVVLNMHFYEDAPPEFEAVRVLPLLANGMAVVSERGSGSERFEGGIRFVDDADEIVDACVELVRNERAREDLELRAAKVARRPENSLAELLRPALADLERRLSPFGSEGIGLGELAGEDDLAHREIAPDPKRGELDVGGRLLGKAGLAE